LKSIKNPSLLRKLQGGSLVNDTTLASGNWL
jgi:hypothetical protein